MTNRVVASKAYSNFVWAIEDVGRLIELYNTGFSTAAEGNRRGIGVLKRATIVMAVTCWETYIEDMLNEEFQYRLQMAKYPRDVQSAFNAAANKWLQSRSRYAVKYIKYMEEWTGDAWKRIVLKHFKNTIQNLSSPSSKKVRKLSKTYLNMDVTSFWHWLGVSQKEACKKLDALIVRRGDLVHRARDLFQSAQHPTKREALASINLVSRLARCTKSGLGWSNWIEIPNPSRKKPLRA